MPERKKIFFLKYLQFAVRRKTGVRTQGMDRCLCTHSGTNMVERWTGAMLDVRGVQQVGNPMSPELRIQLIRPPGMVRAMWISSTNEKVHSDVLPR